MLRPVQWSRLPGGAVLGSSAPGLWPGLGRLDRVEVPDDVQYVRIPNGEHGTEKTLKIMKGLVLSPWGHRHPAVVQLANKIRDHVVSKDYVAEADAILQYMKGNVRYKLDPAGLEWVQTPLYTLFKRHAGDCDDHSTAAAALAMASGHQAAFRTVKADHSRPNQWSHVYPVIGVTKGGRTMWLAADSTQRESTLGWDPPDVYDMQTWVIDPSLEDSSWDS